MNNNVKRHIAVLKKTAKELELNNGEKACENSYSTLWEEYSKSRIYLDDIANHFLSIENYRDFRIIEDVICAY